MARGREPFDAAVIGAGPSGLQTARLLAAGGRRVLVLEKKNEVGSDIVCTGIVGYSIFEEFDLPRTSVVRDIQSVNLVSPLDTVIPCTHSSPFASVVDRGRFDKNIAGLAIREGAEIRCGCEALDLNRDRGYVEITYRNETGKERTCRARAVVVATGVNGNLKKKLNLGNTKEFVNAVQTVAGNTGIGRTPNASASCGQWSISSSMM